MQRSDDADTLKNQLASVLPSDNVLSFCEKYYNLDVRFAYEPLSVMGGDLWGIFPFSDSKVLIYLFDFLGHGEHAARNALFLHKMIQQLAASAADPSKLLSDLNQQLKDSELSPAYASVFVGVYDKDSRKLRCSNAAGPPFYLLSENASELFELTQPSLPVGVKDNYHYTQQEALLVPNDILVLYTDAMTETKVASDGSMFEPTFLELLRRFHTQQVIEKLEGEDLFDTCMAQFKKACQEQVADDFTFITVQVGQHVEKGS